MKWLIVEDALRDRKGHWLEYVSTFVRGLTALGDEVQVLCDRKAEGFVIEQTGALPVLPESIWHRMGDGAGAAKRYLRVPWHAIATFFAMRKFFKKFNHRGHGEHGVGGKREIKCETGRMSEAQCNAQEICAGAFESDSLTSKLAESPVSESPIRSANGPASSPVTSHSLQATAPEAHSPATSYPLPATSSPPDWIFVPTVLVHHLLGWWMLLKLRSVPKKSRVLLFFPNAPVHLADDGRAHMAPDLTGKLFRLIARQLSPEVRSGKVVLGAETHAMRSALTEATGLEFKYLPHPVEAAKLRTKEPRNESSKASVKPIVFGCYGAARWEKGSDVFQAAIRKVLEGNPKILANFVFQWIDDFNDEHGRGVVLDTWLLEHPQVEVIGRYFEGDEYDRRLAQTDVMVLPYRKPYELRLSRVVIEAMLNGMPVIAARGTTLFEQAEEYGIVDGCEEGNAEGLAESMLEVAQNFQMLQTSAELKVHVAAQNFSVACFRKIVMKSSYERK
jgi:glycosyltransferase involved in cell wall biosynthesis